MDVLKRRVSKPKKETEKQSTVLFNPTHVIVYHFRLVYTLFLIFVSTNIHLLPILSTIVFF